MQGSALTRSRPRSWLHNAVYYPTTDDFRTAYSKGLLEKTTRNDGMNSTWIGTDRRGPGASLSFASRGAHCLDLPKTTHSSVR
mgnify:CR=1 FL=1